MLFSCAKEGSFDQAPAGTMRFAVSVEGTTKASMTSTDLQQFFLKVDGPGSAFSYFESITKDQEGKWVASRPILWKDEQSSITYAAASYGALGSAVTVELFNQGGNIPILSDQSTQAKLNAADLLTMKETSLKFADSDGGVVPITLKHGLAKVNFVFTLADEFFDKGIGLEANPVKEVVINGVAAGFNFKPLTGEVTVPAMIAKTAVAPFAGKYVPGTETAKAAVATFESILAPETIAAGALKLYFTVAAKDYQWTNSEALVLAQGGEYTVPVSVAYSTEVGPTPPTPDPTPDPTPLTAPFSVSSTKQVLFSPGNLMYSNGAFSFHTHQYDACVTTTGSSDISSSYTTEGTFDLFGWGTSGNAHRTGYYQPWSIGGTYSNYYAYGNSNKNLYDENGSADWGANAIGTDPAGTWRTLTKDEWTYLFANHTYGYSEVAGVNGYVIRPDGDNNDIEDAYTAEEWNAQEAAGSVFLPIAGRRGTAATNFSYYGTQGTYWSSTDYGTGTYAYNVLMTASSVDCSDYSTKGQGLNVRLVRDAN